MAACLRGGAEAYSFAEACQDRYLDTLAAQVADTALPVTSQSQPWSESLSSHIET